MAEHPKVTKCHVTDKVVSNCLSMTFMLSNVDVYNMIAVFSTLHCILVKQK